MPNIAYVTDIPFEDNDPSVDQPDMKDNTNAINQILNVDHYSFNDNNGGYHDVSTYIDRVSSDPTPLNTDGAQCIAYTKSVSSIAEFFITRFGSATPVQMTSGTFVRSASVVSGANTFVSNQSFLPGNILIKSGTITAAALATSVTVTFTSIGLTNFTATPSVVITANTGSAVWVTGASSGGFTINRAGITAATVYSWTAMGA